MKHNRTRTMAVICCVIIMIFCLTGCGGSAKLGDSAYLGTWKATLCEYEGFRMETESVIGEFSITLQEDGRYTTTIADTAEEGKWEECEGGGVRLDGDEALVFTDTEDGKLQLNYSDIILYFER